MVLIFAAAIIPCAAKTAVTNGIDLPLTAATTWLSVVDAGKYDKSYDAAAQYLKKAIKKDRWSEMLRGVRKPFGKTVSRSETSRVEKKSLPGAPDGQYIVFQFTTVFEQKLSAVETVTVMNEKDGVWRVCGYFIR